MNIAVVGTGYVGLVTGTCLAETGNHVICVDIDEAKVAAMQDGKVPIYEPNLDTLFDRNIAAGRLSFTTELKEAVDHADIVFLALPTPPPVMRDSTDFAATFFFPPWILPTAGVPLGNIPPALACAGFFLAPPTFTLNLAIAGGVRVGVRAPRQNEELR